MVDLQPRPVTLHPLQAPGQCDALARVEALMLDLSTGSRLDRLGTIAREHLDSGGKRLRARLALSTTLVLGASLDNAIPWAAASELLHNATLVHDDLQDGDTLRRGRPTVWARHGMSQAVNTGDLLLMLPFRALEHLVVDDGLRWRLSRCLARAAEGVVRGQADELELLPRRHLTWTYYREAAMGKTSALFELPVTGAAILAGVPDADVLGRAFAKLGLLFQIADDVLDLYGDKGRELPGADLREGKVSILVVEHLRRHPQDTDALLALLEAPREDVDELAVRSTTERFRAKGALAGAWSRLDDLSKSIVENPVLIQHPLVHEGALALLDCALQPIQHSRRLL